MFKRVMIVLVVVAMFFSGVMVVSADEGQTSTSILVQNLTAADNPVTLSFYQTSGVVTAGTKTKTLTSEASTTFDQRYASGDPGMDPFQGAAVLSAEGAIGAVVQMVRSGGSGSVNSYDAYNGLGDTSVAQLIKAPLLLRGVTSAGKTWNTMMSIQNTSLTASAHVTVTYAPDGLGNAYTASYTIPGGGSQYVKQETETNLGAKFFGSATIAADQDVGVVVTSGSSDGASLIAYPTFTSGSAVAFLPGTMKSIPSLGDVYFTSFTIVNMGTAPVTVTVEYQALAGTVGAAYDVVVNTSKTIDQRYDTAITSATFVGAVKLTATGGTIAAMLNSRGDTPAGAGKYATTFGGFASGVTTAFTPYLLKYITSAGYNWSTSILIVNMDPAGGPITVNLSYKEDPAIGTHTYSSSKQVAVFDYVDLRYDANLAQATFYGAAKLTCTRPFAVVVLVRGSSGTGDAYSSYLGISQ